MGSFATFLVMFALQAETPPCEIQAQKKIPQIFLVGEGQPSDWSSEFEGTFSQVFEDNQQIRARIFKKARTKNLPLLSQTFLSLNGLTVDRYVPHFKAYEDPKNQVYGIESDHAVALAENYRLMSAYFNDRLKGSAFARLQQAFFHTLRYPFLRGVWDEIYQKADLFGISGLKMGVRRINNAFVEYDRKHGKGSLRGKISVTYSLRNHFVKRVSGPLKKNKESDAIAKKIVETFHQRLVERVNRRWNSNFLFYGKKDEEQRNLKAFLQKINSYQEAQLGDQIKQRVCQLASEPAVVVMVHLSHLKAIETRIKGLDKRIKVKSFNLFDPGQRKKVLDFLMTRWAREHQKIKE